MLCMESGGLNWRSRFSRKGDAPGEAGPASDSPSGAAVLGSLAGLRTHLQARMFTARATTSPRMISEIKACTPIVSLAQCRIGMTSVGLNAVAFVRPR